MLLVDANSCYTPEKAIEVGRLLEDHGVCHFEEPCPYWEFEWTAKWRTRSTSTWPAASRIACSRTWRRIIGMRAVDVVQPDVCYLGGLTRTLRSPRWPGGGADRARPHSANLSMVTVFTLHLMGAIPNAGPYVEFSIEPDDYYPWQEGLFSPPLEVQDGYVHVPDGPGWGVEISPSWLAQADHIMSEV